jgi:hypothetical protein
MKARLICLIRRHQWHNGWNEDEHVPVWTCKRCGKTKGGSANTGYPRSRSRTLPWGVGDGGGGGDFGGGDGGGGGEGNPVISGPADVQHRPGRFCS